MICPFHILSNYFHMIFHIYVGYVISLYSITHGYYKSNPNPGWRAEPNARTQTQSFFPNPKPTHSQPAPTGGCAPQNSSQLFRNGRVRQTSRERRPAGRAGMGGLGRGGSPPPAKENPWAGESGGGGAPQLKLNLGMVVGYYYLRKSVRLYNLKNF